MARRVCLLLGRPLMEWEKDAIVDGVIAGEKHSSLAAEFGCSDDYPHVLARRRGVPPRPNGRPPIRPVVPRNKNRTL